MIDLKFLRENPEIVKENIKKKFQEHKLELVDKVIELDKKNRQITMKDDELRNQRNTLSNDIGKLMREGKKEEAEKIKEKVKKINEELIENEKKEVEYANKVKEIMMKIPNIMDDSVPIGKDDSENVENEKFGEPVVPQYDIPYHADIIEKLMGLDKESAGRTSGTGFYYLMGDVARLHSAIFFRREADPESTRDKYKYDYTSPVNSGQNYRAAGVYDAVSMPGNLDKEQLRIFNEENNKKTEDDWDRASAFVIVDPNATRTIEGNVWETVGKPANEWRDNELYPEFEHSYGAKDITAELVEIKKVKENGTEYVKEFVRAKTKTDENGYYKFTEYIPGQYVVRFIYGDTANYDTKEQYSPYTEFELNEYKVKSAYNGQFYQSGKANPNTNLNDSNHKNYNQYWYANETDTRYSDAYDEVNRRMEVNELLKTYKYSDILSLLKHPTDYMVYAYTSLLDVEVEYAKEETNGQDPAYTIRNIDFALTPRTEAKLDIKKEVKRIKLVLQNGTVQFDADTETIRRQGVPAVLQAAQGHDINISMSSELVNGATLEITYEITIENVSPLDTITYYKNQDEKIIALGFYEEDPTKIIYYENDKMRTYENKVATENNTKVLLFSRPEQTTWTSMIISGITNKEQLDPNRNERIVTTTGANEVADYISKNLNFTKQSYTGEEINKAWDLVTVSKDDFDKEYYRQKQDDDVEESLKPIIGEASQKSEDRIANLLEMDASEVYDSNTIVISNSQNGLIKDLEPRGTASEEIVLSKVISVNDSSTDTKSYNNNVRIIRINNSVSRIQNMAATNLKYTSEKVIVSDPTGIGNKYLPIILTLVVVTIIGSGIILVKKFVINK